MTVCTEFCLKQNYALQSQTVYTLIVRNVMSDINIILHSKSCKIVYSKYVWSNMCIEANFVFDENDHYNREYCICATDPIFYLQVKNKP
jgi:hypothetical protein